MQISVIIPCHNCESFVAAAINSLLDQTSPAHEIIAIDDGSTDDTSQIVNQFGRRVTLYHQDNRGAGAAVNTGIERAEGSLLAFIDSDDLWTRDKLQVQAKILGDEPDVQGVFGFIQNFMDEEATQTPSSSSFQGPPIPGMTRDTLLVRREFFDRIGPFNEKIRHGEFIDWYARATAAGFRWLMAEQVVCFRRIHGGNLGIRDKSQQRDDYLTVLKNILDRRRDGSPLED